MRDLKLVNAMNGSYLYRCTYFDLVVWLCKLGTATLKMPRKLLDSWGFAGFPAVGFLGKI